MVTRRRTLHVLAAGERGVGTTVASALLALGASTRGTAVHVAASGRGTGFRWRAAAGRAPVAGVASAAASPVLRVTSALDAVIAPEGDDLPPSVADRVLARLPQLLDDYDTVVVDAGTRVATVAAVAQQGALQGADVRFLVATASGAASCAAAYALLKGARQHGVPVPASVVLLGDDDQLVSTHATIAEAAQRFLGERPEAAGAIPRDVCLTIALRGGMSFVDAVLGSPAALAAEALITRLEAGVAADANTLAPMPASTPGVTAWPAVHGLQPVWGS